MKLFDVPHNTKIRVVDPHLGTSTQLKFKHIDGMYSYCIASDGEVVHLAAWTEVEIVESANEVEFNSRA